MDKSQAMKNLLLASVLALLAVSANANPLDVIGGSGSTVLSRDQKNATIKQASELEVGEKERKWSVGLAFELPASGFAVSTAANVRAEVRDPLQDLTYSPAFNPITSLRVGYENYGLTYSKRLELSQLKSHEDELRLGQYVPTRNLFAEVYYHAISGMQTDLMTAQETPSRVIERPDVRYRNIGAQFVGTLPLNNSGKTTLLENLHGHFKMPESENGDFELLAGGNVGYYSMRGDAPFVPTERQASYGAGSSLSAVRSTNLGVGVGLGYTYGIADTHAFVASILGGPSLSWARAQFDNDMDRSLRFGFYMNSRFGYLYQGKRSQFGADIAFDAWNLEAREMNVTADYFSFLIHQTYFF